MTAPLQSTAQLKQLMTEHFTGVDRAARERSAPVAWCTSVGPVELLRALGYQVFFPENHGALLGASRAAGETMVKAHALGYSPDICSYLTSDIGSYLLHKTPLARYGLEAAPRADVLVFSTNQCREVRDWFEFYGRAWSVPVVGVTSFRDLDAIEPHHLDAIVRQLEALVPPLEAVAGRRLDASQLELALARSRTCSTLWRDCLRTSAARPAALTFFDATIHMAPAVVLRGTAEACDYYRQLEAELAARVRAGAGGLPRERFRLYWDGMPIWGKLRDLAALFEQLETSIVASTYCNSWVFEALDPRDPLRSMARASLELFIARSEGPKQRYLQRMVEEFAVDGVLFHDSKTCPNNSNARFGLPQRLRRATGVPVLVLDGDLNDLRCFSEEQARTNIEGFVEQLEGSAPPRRVGADVTGAAPYYAGVDCGSWNTKAALVDGEGRLVATAVVRTGADVQGAAERAVGELLERAGVDRASVASLWATGFGRHAVEIASSSRTELDAHARGTLQFVKGPLTVIDIGGQDAKIILVDEQGRRVGHKMNRKCAAGTGSFLEEMALRLDVGIGELPALAAGSTEEIALGSFCTVFTGTEVLHLIREGKRPADLARAAYRSVVKRVLEMERVEGQVVATGGVVAHHPMVVELLEDALGSSVTVPPHTQEIGALGVAVAAREAAALAA